MNILKRLLTPIFISLPLVTLAEPFTPKRPVATYSIVARDAATGEIGVAVQSHWFSVGAIVPWAEAGVGAVATQSFVDPSYGPLGLKMMALGKSADDALAALLVADSDKAVRQVAMIDASGNVAAHTGKNAIFAAGHQIGKNYSVQANLMDKDTVWPAMAKAFENTKGDLAERMMVALEAAEKEGGDIRGKQSAAIIVVSGKPSGKSWVDRKFDLRVEDHPQPLKELRRLIRFQRAYAKLDEGDGWMTKNQIDKALEAYQQASTLVGDNEINGEASFWIGVTLVGTGKKAEAIAYLRRAYQQDKRWGELLPRLPASQILPDDDKLIKELVAGMKR